jgi:hypothetical protein
LAVTSLISAIFVVCLPWWWKADEFSGYGKVDLAVWKIG